MGNPLPPLQNVTQNHQASGDDVLSVRKSHIVCGQARAMCHNSLL